MFEQIVKARVYNLIKILFITMLFLFIWNYYYDLFIYYFYIYLKPQIDNLVFIPFLFEFLIALYSFWYIIICCFSNQKWWNSNIILRFYFWIKKFLMLLIVISIYIIYEEIIEQDLIENGLYFGKILKNDFNNMWYKTILSILVFFSISSWFRYLYFHKDFWNSINEFALIFLSCIFTLFTLLSINDLFALIFLIIAMSISIYGLILINVPILPKSAETGAKYFLLSIMSVALMFGGTKEIYLYTGHLNYYIINNSIFEYFSIFTKYNELYPLKMGLLFIMVGFFFKLTAAPMHFWGPEIYSGLPYELLIFIAIPIKYVLSIIFFKLIKNIFYIFALSSNANILLFNEIEYVLIITIILSMVIGAINACFETNIKKFIAYSSINQIGFLLISLLGTNCNYFCFVSFIYFLLIYVFNLLFFVIYLIYISQIILIPNFFYDNILNKLKNFKIWEIIPIKFIFNVCFNQCRNTLKVTYLTDLKKIFFISYLSNPHVYNSFNKFFNLTFFTLNIFSLAGIPPFMGFFSKVYILSYALQINNKVIFFIGILTSILTIFYYLRIIKIIFFENQKDTEIFINTSFNYKIWSIAGFNNNENFKIPQNEANLHVKNIFDFFGNITKLDSLLKLDFYQVLYNLLNFLTWKFTKFFYTFLWFVIITSFITFPIYEILLVEHIFNIYFEQPFVKTF